MNCAYSTFLLGGHRVVIGEGGKTSSVHGGATVDALQLTTKLTVINCTFTPGFIVKNSGAMTLINLPMPTYKQNKS